MSKLAIWIIGSSGVGKTTLAMEIHKFIAEMMDSEMNPKVIGWGERNRQFMYTKMSPYSANLGEFGLMQCGGTDTLSTKDRISKSYEKAIQKCPIVVIEGIMATGQWIHWIQQPDVRLLLIHVEISIEGNLKRLRSRRAAKTGTSIKTVEIHQKTVDNLNLKLRTFRNLYRKMTPHANYHLQINSEVLSRDRSVEVLKAYMLEHIFLTNSKKS